MISAIFDFFRLSVNAGYQIVGIDVVVSNGMNTGINNGQFNWTWWTADGVNAIDPVLSYTMYTDNTVSTTADMTGLTTIDYYLSGAGAVKSSSADSTSIDYSWTITVAPSAVPLPATVWLFGSGLLGIIGISRHKKST